MYQPPADVPVLGIGKEGYSSIDEAIEKIKKEHVLIGTKIIPKFTSVVEERHHRLQRMVAGFRIFAKLGYDEGVAGHITVRDPENPHNFWVNPFARYFGALKIEDFILVNHLSEVISGTGTLNKAAFVIHSAVHEARPDVVAAVHSHSMYGKVWSTTGRLLEPITQDSCSFYQDHALSEPFSGVVYDNSEGISIANSLGTKKGIILRNHGLLTVGDTVDAAIWNFIALERTCHAQILAEGLGRPIQIDHDTARLTRYQTGTPFASWLQFQPMFEMIVKEQPDILSDNAKV